jgi:hypothetical protein
VSFGARRVRVEPEAVVPEAQDDVVILFAHHDPDVPRLRVFHRVHHTFPSDVVHEQRDRGREVDVGDVAIEADR